MRQDGVEAIRVHFPVDTIQMPIIIINIYIEPWQFFISALIKNCLYVKKLKEKVTPNLEAGEILCPFHPRPLRIQILTSVKLEIQTSDAPSVSLCQFWNSFGTCWIDFFFLKK